MRPCAVCLRRIPGVCQLLDIVDDTQQFPLRVDLRAAAQGEPIKTLVLTHVSKHRLDRGEPLRILREPRRRVEPRVHQRGSIRSRRITGPAKEGDVSHRPSCRAWADTVCATGTARNRASRRETVPTHTRSSPGRSRCRAAGHSRDGAADPSCTPFPFRSSGSSRKSAGR